MPFSSVQGNLTSGGISSLGGVTSEALIAANPSRRYLLINNVSNSNDVYINFTGAAAAQAAGSIKIKAGDSLQWTYPGFVPVEAVNAFGAAGSAITYKEA